MENTIMIKPKLEKCPVCKRNFLPGIAVKNHIIQSAINEDFRGDSERHSKFYKTHLVKKVTVKFEL